MKSIILPGIVLCVVAAGTLCGQTRAAYQQAYLDWQQSDMNLERDAATAGGALGPQTEKAANAAINFVAARRAFYEAQRARLVEQLMALRPVRLTAEKQDASTEGYLSAQETSVTNNIAVFRTDPDKGVQQLGQALEKERAALVALINGIKMRETVVDGAVQANVNADQARNEAADQIQAISSSFQQSANNAGELAEAWPAYYRALANGARGVWTGDAVVSGTPPAHAPSPASGIQASRYAGSWIFSFGVSTYRGPSPFSFDLFVREADGQIFGTVNARFILTGNADPEVQFAFSGPMQAGRRQAFQLQTAEGASGTIELIPGAAVNQLEVNYSLNNATGKVSQAGAVLVRR